MIKLSAPQINQSEKKLVLEVLKSGYIAAGPKTKKFEEQFSRFIGTKFAVATSNGTSALHTSLKCLGIKEKDAVITTPLSFIATSNAIVYCGAKPVFCDINPHTFNIDPQEIKKILKKNSRVKAILCVHLFGLPCDMEEIKSICRQKGIFLIEDCAQAHGAEYKGKKAGSFGNCAAFSFYATKNMTSAEGGMITTDDKSLAKRCRQFINHGRATHNKFSTLGYNYRLTDIASAIGLAQLKKINSMNRDRIKNAAYLTKNLTGLKNITPPFAPPGYKHVFHQYAVKIKKRRTMLIKRLLQNKIESTAFYPIPIYRQPIYKKLGLGNIYLKNTEEACSQILCLPVNPTLKKEALKKIIRVIKNEEN